MDTSTDIAGETLTTVVIVVERLFKFLTARQLNTCARVCKLWYDRAQREKKSRRKLRWNCFNYEGMDRDDLDEDWWKSIVSFITESPMEPESLIIFCTETLWRSVMEMKCPGKKKRKTERKAEEVFTPYLPKGCLFHVIITDGIIGTDTKMKTIELEEYDTAMSVLMFGKSPGVDFVTFSLSHDDCLALAKFWSEGQCDTLPSISSLESRKVKMINLYCPMSGIDQEIGYSLFRKFQWPLIAGGYVNERLLKECNSSIKSSVQNSIISGVAFCGQEVKVASVLIRSNVDTEKDVDKVMQGLKEHDLPLHNSFGLMYACVGRGVHVYRKHNVESSIFRKYFPNTPLFGFFGNGEIGCTFPPADPLFVGDERQLQNRSNSDDVNANSNCSEQDGADSETGAQLRQKIAEMKQQQETYRLKHPPKLLHAYTTVMCLVSLP